MKFLITIIQLLAVVHAGHFSVCSGVYDQSVSSNHSPFISVELTKLGKEMTTLQFSTLIFHYKDLLKFNGIPTIQEFASNAGYRICSDPEICEVGQWILSERQPPEDQIINQVLKNKITYDVKNTGLYCVFIAYKYENDFTNGKDYFDVVFQQPYGYLPLNQKQLYDFNMQIYMPFSAAVAIAYLLRLIYISANHKEEISLVESNPIISGEPLSLDDIANTIVEPVQKSTRYGITLLQRILHSILALEFFKTFIYLITLYIANTEKGPWYLYVFVALLTAGQCIQTMLVFFLSYGWGIIHKSASWLEFPNHILHKVAAFVGIQSIVNLAVMVNTFVNMGHEHASSQNSLLTAIAGCFVVIGAVWIYINLRRTNQEISQYMDKGLVKKFTTSYRLCVIVPSVLCLVAVVLTILHVYLDGFGDHKFSKPIELQVTLTDISWNDTQVVNIVMLPMLSSPFVAALLAWLWDNVNPDEFTGADVVEQNVPSTGRIVLHE